MSSGSKTRPPKKSDDEIFRLLETRYIHFTIHAIEEADNDGLSRAEVVDLLKGRIGKRWRAPQHDKFESDYWKYRILGYDRTEREIAIIVLFDPDPLTVTVFKIKKSI